MGASNAGDVGQVSDSQAVSDFWWTTGNMLSTLDDRPRIVCHTSVDSVMHDWTLFMKDTITPYRTEHKLHVLF